MIKGVHILPPEQNFRGISYGNWSALWWNWLLSKDPDYYNGHEILFLRGNVNYGPVGGVKGAPRDLGRARCYDKTRDKGEKIWSGTPIFFPVINAAYCLGDVYEGIKLTEEEDLRYAARKDIMEGGDMRVEVSSVIDTRHRIVNNLKEYLIESPLFDLTVSSKSKLRYKMENMLRPGKYKCVTVGYYILIKYLCPGKYHLEFEAKGRGSYYTQSLYDITVRGRKRDFVKDVSGSKIRIEHR
jgi:hypothetical protein